MYFYTHPQANPIILQSPQRNTEHPVPRFPGTHIFTVRLPVADGGSRCWPPLSRRETRRRRRAGGLTSGSTWGTSSRVDDQSRVESVGENRGRNSRKLAEEEGNDRRVNGQLRSCGIERSKCCLSFCSFDLRLRRGSECRARSSGLYVSLGRAREVFWWRRDARRPSYSR